VYPTLFHLGRFAVPTHEVFLGLGVLAAVALFAHEARRRGVLDGATWSVAAGALFGGAVFAKAATAWRYVADTGDFSVTGILVHGGKSIVGGLAGAYLGALVTKRVIGCRERTGDLFAAGVALGVAVGRVGCFLTEPIGTPTSLPWGFTPPAAVAARVPNCPQCLLGVPLHPSLLYEAAGCLALFALLWWLRDRVRVPGAIFDLFLAGYWALRFAVEFWRGSPEMALGLSGTQLFLLATGPLLALQVVRQARRVVLQGWAPRPLAWSGGKRVRAEVTAFCPACHRDDPSLPLDRVRRLPARLIENGQVHLVRTCPDHGTIATLYQESPRLLDYLERWQAPTRGPTPDNPGADGPVPGCYARGLGPRQRQHTCILLEEVTDRCNLRCPTCFAASDPALAGVADRDAVLASVDRRLERDGGSLDVVMLSGGEPTLHPDLPAIIEALAGRNIVRILLNTNGLRLAHDDGLLALLQRHRDRVEVYFQFDGFRTATWEHHRGRDLAAVKAAALRRLSGAGVFTTLVMTAELGVNDDEIGAVVRLALDTPYVGGLCIQPAFGSGRSTGIDPMRRLTHTGVLARLGPQTAGEVAWKDLIALPCSHPHCASVGYLVRTDSGRWRSLVGLVGHRRLAANLDLISNRMVDPHISDELRDLVRNSLRGLHTSRASLGDGGVRRLFAAIGSAIDLGVGDLVRLAGEAAEDQEALRALLATRIKRIQVKPFMDLNTMVEERLLQCCVHVGTAVDGRHQAAPFCAVQAWPTLAATKLASCPDAARRAANP
jgi:uncharacterized radical SAM superfamily Fe-S cluster-containing enzyme/prolipoprotein diacylglyceryltransferase